MWVGSAGSPHVASVRMPNPTANRARRRFMVHLPRIIIRHSSPSCQHVPLVPVWTAQLLLFVSGSASCTVSSTVYVVREPKVLVSLIPLPVLRAHSNCPGLVADSVPASSPCGLLAAVARSPVGGAGGAWGVVVVATFE